MKNEIRAVRLDRGLYVEAYRFQGTVQPFPNHFHEHYAIGLIEDGQRLLSCKSREYLLCPGSLLLLNPGDSHACTQYGGGALDYRGLHIPSSTLRMLTEQEGFRELPGFAQPVLLEEKIARRLRSLHEDMMRGRSGNGAGAGRPAVLPAAPLRTAPCALYAGMPPGDRTDLCLYPPALSGAGPAGTALPLRRTEPLLPAADICQIQGHHSLPLSGDRPHSGGADAAGTGGSSGGCRRADRLFRPESPEQPFPPSAGLCPRRVPRHFF